MIHSAVHRGECEGVDVERTDEFMECEADEFYLMFLHDLVFVIGVVHSCIRLSDGTETSIDDRTAFFAHGCQCIYILNNYRHVS